MCMEDGYIDTSTPDYLCRQKPASKRPSGRANTYTTTHVNGSLEFGSFSLLSMTTASPACGPVVIAAECGR